MKCKECKYFQKDDKRLIGEIGWCYRYPPGPRSDPHPIVDETEFCGEYAPQPIPDYKFNDGDPLFTERKGG